MYNARRDHKEETTDKNPIAKFLNNVFLVSLITFTLFFTNSA